MDDNIVAAYALCLYSIANYINVVKRKNVIVSRRRRRQRRCWMTSIHRNRTRSSMDNSIREINSKSGEFSNFCKMSQIDFAFLLNKIEHLIKKKDTQMRIAIPANIRLAITLRYLATGDSYRSLHLLFKVSHQVISLIVPEVCRAINCVLKDQIKLPQTPEEWLVVEEGFKETFPRCIGAIDGKRILVQCPSHSGFGCTNFKKTYSVVLTTLVDSDHRFLFADIGDKGQICGGGIFEDSSLWQQINTGTLNLPSDITLPGREINVPYVFLGTDAFHSHKHIMKPFPGNHSTGTKEHTFNYKLSSSRMIVKNVFRVLTSVFRIFTKPIEIEMEKVRLITKTCILLHNYLRNSEHSRNIYSPSGTFDSVGDETCVESLWGRNHTNTSGIISIEGTPTDAPSDINEIRNEFADYFYNLE